MSIYETVVKDLKGAGFDFRINDLDEAKEISIKGKPWVRYNDTHEDILKVDMMEMGYSLRNGDKPSLSTMLSVTTKLADKQRYDPAKEYFDSLPTYEPRTGDNGPQPYKVPALAKFFDNPDKYFGLWLFKWMVGAIAKIYEQERNPMLVLAGPQGTGKSYFCKWLTPLNDGERFVRGAINPDNKDHRIRLNSILVWEVEELASTTRRADVNALKSFITQNSTYERPPFKKHPMHKKTITSFIGTENPDGAGFLNDTTGSTRFLVCEIQQIDFDYSKNINPDDLWSEALWFYKNIPLAWQLSPDQDKARRIINARYEVMSALEDALLLKLEITRDKKDFMTTQDIKQAIYDIYRITNEQAFYNEMGRVGEKLGIQRGRGSRELGYPRGWLGVKERENIGGS